MPTWNNLKSRLGRRKSAIKGLQSFSDFGITSRRWWGSHQVEEGQSKFWRVGNMVVCVDRVANEWHVASCPVGKIFRYARIKY